jgi:hypothetical protein
MAYDAESFTHGQHDTEDEWEYLNHMSGPTFELPGQEHMSSINNHMKSKPDRSVDNDVLTLLSYAQGDCDLLERAIRDHGGDQTDNDFC